MIKDFVDYMIQAGYTALSGGAKVRTAEKLIRDGVLIPKEDILFVKKGTDTSLRKAPRTVVLTESGCRKLEKKLKDELGMPWDIMPEEKTPSDKLADKIETEFTKDAVKELPFNEPITEPVDKHTFYETAMSTINDLKEKVKQMEKEVLFAKSVKASDDCINVGMMARILFMNGVDTSERKLFKWLHENGWLEDMGDFKNIPTEKAVEKGYMKFNECAVTTNAGRVHLSFTPKITGEGQEYFTNIFMGYDDE